MRFIINPRIFYLKKIFRPADRLAYRHQGVGALEAEVNAGISR